MSQATVFSFLYLGAFFVYFCFGSYVLFLNAKSRTNRLFTAVCFTLCVWTFAYSVVISAPDYDTAFFWRRLSALGWGTFHSVFMHLCLSMTEKDRLLAKPWAYFLLYGPAAVTVWVFGVNGETASLQHVLVQTASGWVNVFANNFWDYFFNAYFVAFDVGAIWLVWRWGARTQTKAKQAQSRILTVSFVLALILGALFDVFLNAYTVLKVPQLASVFILIPIGAFLYCIRRYGLMLPEVGGTPEMGRILSEVRRRQIYLLIGITLAAAGVVNLVLYSV